MAILASVGVGVVNVIFTLVAMQLIDRVIVALSFLTLTQVMGKPATFWLFGVISIGAWLFAFFLVPETKGRSLEQIEAHWRAGKPPREL